MPPLLRLRQTEPLSRRPSSACCWRRDERLRRDAPLAVQLPGHSHRDGTLAGHDVGCPLTRAEQAAEIGLGIAAGFHAVTDRIDSVGRFDRPALALIVLDDQCEKIEA